ncbi:MAG: zf-HC2 domain-containing protein [Candidatus Latescibacteria bacterium]|nr:zf-HC2 domain-containing protein [Candidatus Latescibacterota bacterium]
MNCPACERQLSAYIDDQLALETRLELEAHLDECPRCRADFESHQAVWEAAHLSAGEAPPATLWEGIISRLEQPAQTTRLDDLALMLRGLAAQVQDLQRGLDELRQDLGSAAEPETLRQGIRVRTNPFAPGPPRESSVARLVRRSS